MSHIWLQFLAAWTIQKMTESTRLVQLSGFFQMGPLVFGPLLGKLADGTSKLKVEKVGLFFVLLCSGVIAACALFQWPVDIVGAEVMAVLEAELDDGGGQLGDRVHARYRRLHPTAVAVSRMIIAGIWAAFFQSRFQR